MSEAPQGEGWWQASDGRWYPPAGQDGPATGAATPPAAPSGSSGAPASVSVPLPALSAKLLAILAWAVLAAGLLTAFWVGFIADGPDDFTDKVGYALSALPGWALTWAVLLVGSVLAARDER